MKTKNIKAGIGMYAFILILILVFALFSGNLIDLTGRVVGEYVLKEKAFEVNKHFSETGVYLWSPGKNISIKDLSVEGDIYGTGNVEVSLIKGGKKVTLLKRTTSKETVAVEEYVELPEGTDIGLTLEYGTGDWDFDDDGVASLTDGIDFELNPLFFFDIDRKFVCTLWEVYSLERADYTSTCYGASGCCNFLGPSSSSYSWNDDFVLVSGNPGVTTNNIVLARVVFYNGTKVSYSNYDGLPAKFVKQEIINSFNESGDEIFESKNYLIKIELAADTFFNFKTIKYKVEELEEEIEEGVIMKEEVEEEVIPEIELTPSGYKIFKEEPEEYFEMELEESYLNNLRINTKDILLLEMEIKLDLTDSYQKITFLTDETLNAVANLKIPINKIEGRELIVNNGAVEVIYLRNDGQNAYYRANIELTELSIVLLDKLEELASEKSKSKEWKVYLYFIISLMVAVCIYFFAGAGQDLKDWADLNFKNLTFKREIKRIRKLREQFEKKT